MWVSTTSDKFATLYLLVLVACGLSISKAGISGKLLSTKSPMALNLNRAMVNETGLIRVPRSGVRTRSQFFEKTLGLEPGKPFNFDLSKWKAIQRSGLFKNLTAKAIPVGANEVLLTVTGQELPSIRFSPEVSVAASIDRPEVSGGVSFSDRNFRGLGQRMDISVTKKEGRERGTDQLGPTIGMKWTDNRIGKTSSLSVGYEEESRFEDGADVLPDMRLARYMDLGIRTRNRFETRIRKSFVRFREFDFLRMERRRERDEENGLVPKGNCQMDVEVEPYRTHLDSEMCVSELQGAKISANWQWKEGHSAGVSHDGGVGLFAWGTAPYRQLSAETASALYKIYGSSKKSVKTVMSSAEDGSAIISLPDEEGNISPLQVIGKFRSSMMKSWGGACLPLFHKIPLGDSLTVRSYADIPEPDLLDLFGRHKKRTSAFVALKGDFYLEGLKTFIPGAFMDCALSRSLTVSEESSPTSAWERSLGAGLSLRAFGFRLDAAWPLIEPKTSIRFHIGVDFGA